MVALTNSLLQFSMLAGLAFTHGARLAHNYEEMSNHEEMYGLAMTKGYEEHAVDQRQASLSLTTRLYDDKFKIQAFSDIHGRVATVDPAAPLVSNFEDFKTSPLGVELEKGSASVLVYLGDMTLVPTSKHDKEQIPPGSVCAPCIPIIEEEIKAFAEWMGSLSSEQYPVKIVVPGNHDTCLDPLKADESVVQRLEAIFHANGIHYLGGGKERVGTVSVVASSESDGKEHRLNVVGMGISEARSMGCTGAFQHPPATKPALDTLRGVFKEREQLCGEECSQMVYDAEYNKVLDALQTGSDVFNGNVHLLLMHGPPDNAGSTFKNAPSGRLVDLVQELQPSLIFVGHIHGNDRRVAFAEPYTLGTTTIYNVAVKNEGPANREEEPRFIGSGDIEHCLPSWDLAGDVI